MIFTHFFSIKKEFELEYRIYYLRTNLTVCFFGKKNTGTWEGYNEQK